MAVRVTNHSGRVGKKGVYSAKHNDRNFSLKNAKHIDPNRSSENVYWKFNEEKIPLSERNPDATFDEHESLIYDSLFSTQLAKINSNYMKQRHKEKIQSMEHFRTKNRQYCPEETLMYLGNSEECVSPEILESVFEEYKKWHEETFPMCLWLDAAMHLDERTPHIHERHVWTASYTEYARHYNETHKKEKELPDFEHGEKDYLMIGQTESLRQMEIEPPNPKKAAGQHNNVKQTYSKMCRKKIADIGKKFGVEIILEPKEGKHNGMDLSTYKAEAAKSELKKIQAETAQLTQENKSVKEEIQKGKAEVSHLSEEIETQTAQLTEIKNQVIAHRAESETLKTKIDELQQEIFNITLPDTPVPPTKPTSPRPTESKEKYVQRMIDDSLRGLKKMSEEKKLAKEYDCLIDEWNSYDSTMKQYSDAYREWVQMTGTVTALQARLEEVAKDKKTIEDGQRAIWFQEELKQKRQMKELQEKNAKLQSELDSIRNQIQSLAEQEYQRRRKCDAEVIAYYKQYCGISPDEIEIVVMEQGKQDYDLD